MIYDELPLEYIMKIENEWRYYDGELKMPFPWYTRPCLEWLVTVPLLHKIVWEYGLGDSSTWYMQKGVFQIGVDSNSFYATKHYGMHETTKYRYCTAIETAGAEFDIIVIDGIFRDECTQYALEFLKPGGYLIIDNYKQPSVQADWPLTEKLIEGMDVKYFKEPGHPDWQTIVVTK
jgi:hypothetical protein